MLAKKKLRQDLENSSTDICVYECVCMCVYAQFFPIRTTPGKIAKDPTGPSTMLWTK